MMCVQIGECRKRSFEVISHTPESIDSWLNELRKEAKCKIAVADQDPPMGTIKTPPTLHPLNKPNTTINSIGIEFLTFIILLVLVVSLL